MRLRLCSNVHQKQQPVAGQTDLARAIFGLLPVQSGTVAVESQEVRIVKPTDAIRHGIGFLTRDRRQSLVPALPIPPNVTLAGISQMRMHEFLRLNREEDKAAEYVESLRIQPPALDRPVMFLSGGNQQKVLLARWP